MNITNIKKQNYTNPLFLTYKDLDRVNSKNPSSVRGDILLTAKEVGEKLRLGKTATYDLLQHGDIPVIKINGRTIRVRQADLENYMRNNSKYKRKIDNKIVF